MGTQARIFAGLLVLWVMVVVGLAVWPSSGPGVPDASVTRAGFDPAADVFEHTGRWVVEVDPDGTAVFVREIRRQ